MLSPATLAAYRRDGFIVLPDILDVGTRSKRCAG